MIQLHQRVVIHLFVSAKMIFVVQRSRLYPGERSGPKLDLSVVAVLMHYFHVHGSHFDTHDLIQELARHTAREADQRGPLIRRCAIIHNQDGFGWIGIGGRVAKSRVRFDYGYDSESVKAFAVPVPLLNLPRKNRLIARKADLGVGKTRPRPDIGATRLYVVARNLLSIGNRRNGESDKTRRRKHQKPSHWILLSTSA